MKEKIYQWGFMGYGQVARERMGPAVAKHSRSELHAVASKSADAEKTPGNVFYHDYQSLLDDDTIDIIYIALPNTMHAQWAIKALNSGKHVLCEKPLAMNCADLDAVAEASQASGCRVMEGFMYRYSSRMEIVENYLRQGLIGEVTYVQSNFFSLQSRIVGIRADKALGGGALWDLGCYPVSLITALLGTHGQNSLETVQAVGRKQADIDVYLAGELVYSSGAIGSFSCGWISDVRDITTMIIGTKGILQAERLFNWDEGSLKLILPSGVQVFDLPAEDPFEKEVSAFLDHIEHDSDLIMSLMDSRRVLDNMEKIRDSLVLL